ncbi:carboxylating nicotinate-nucleotide diphosphorylase [Clostridium oceanicum]|uniref:nicotinate-nucleotide diphosphorylase (carboxylating) n=1 Tax=Clostridium oceanicum TaxID=1543 RepID=A0ABN1JN66_9CLOT
MNWFLIDKIIDLAFREDIPYGDITTESIVGENSECFASLLAKEEGIIAGLPIFKRVFHILGSVEVDFIVKEGAKVKKGQLIGILKGNAQNVLKGERIALNILQRLSGIATKTNKFAKEVEKTKAKVLDTRKTTPNFRYLEKYAVKIGGGYNHRYNLSEAVLIKDNHIDVAGSIENAVNSVRKSFPTRTIEVEVEDIKGVREALNSKVNIIMLDNMSIEDMKEAVSIIDSKALIEASGNVSLENIKFIAKTGVDFISVGSLTHSFKSLDISLKNLKIK